MSSHRPRRSEQISNASSLLDAMGRCRRTVVDAQDGVKAFGVMFHGCGMVVSAIDALAHLITGQPHYYSIAGSRPDSPAHLADAAAGRPSPTGSRTPTGPGPDQAPDPVPRDD